MSKSNLNDEINWHLGNTDLSLKLEDKNYDLSDFDNLSEENEFFGLPYDKNTDSLIKQYLQTKIDQEVKKRDEEWIQALEKRNKAILS